MKKKMVIIGDSGKWTFLDTEKKNDYNVNEWKYILWYIVYE